MHQRIVIVLSWALVLLTQGIVVHAAESYRVHRVVDGYTTIRLVGIDAPETSKAKREPGQPYGQAATKHLAAVILNKAVTIWEYGRDRYGRVLAVVFLNGTDINIEMVKAGLAEVYQGTPAPGFDNEPYLKAEREAQAAGREMWVQGDKYVSPRQWRNKRGQ
jgi:endonuclease YncB( thermonuclease family)